MSAKKDVTETEIAKAVKKPLSTIHYNMKALVAAKLVKSDEYHYSPKGKEVNHYRLANQYVVIAPEGEKAAIKEKLKSIIPTALIMGAAAVIIKMFSRFGFTKMAESADSLAFAPRDMAAPMMAKSAEWAGEAVAGGAPAPMADGVQTVASYAMEEAAEEIAVEASNEIVRSIADDAMNEVVVESVQHVPEVVHTNMPYVVEKSSNAPEIALWFFIGAVAGVSVYLLVSWVRKKLRS